MSPPFDIPSTWRSNREGPLKKDFQGLPPATAQVGEEFSVIEEILAEYLGYAENEMAVRHGLQYLFAKPFEKIIRHTSQWDNPAYKSGSR